MSTSDTYRYCNRHYTGECENNTASWAVRKEFDLIQDMKQNIYTETSLEQTIQFKRLLKHTNLKHTILKHTILKHTILKHSILMHTILKHAILKHAILKHMKNACYSYSMKNIRRI